MSDETTDVKGALKAIEELRIDAKIGKGKHFSAGDRKLFLHKLMGVPVILANLFVGIVVFNLQAGSGPDQLEPVSTDGIIDASNARSQRVTMKGESTLSLVSVLLAFSAAALSALQTFLNFQKAAEGHRAIGNRYISVVHRCKILQQRHLDLPYTAVTIWSEYDKIHEDYIQANIDAEGYPTSKRDLKNARMALEVSPYKNPHA